MSVDTELECQGLSASRGVILFISCFKHVIWRNPRASEPHLSTPYLANNNGVELSRPLDTGTCFFPTMIPIHRHFHWI